METKIEWKFFTVVEHEEEQRYLREMHNAGWKFVRVSGFCLYHFEKCTPEDVIYQLDYNPEGKDKAEYVQMFRDCGWEYLQDYVGYSYFRKASADMNGEEEIFCDDESRLRMIERVFRGKMIPLLVILCAILLPQIGMQLMWGNYSVVFLLAVFIGLYVCIFVRFARLYRRYKDGK